MTDPEHSVGKLLMLFAEESGNERSVAFQFADGIAGELKVLSGDSLLVGETYLLSDGDRTRRIEVVKESGQSHPHNESGAEYHFRVV